MLQTTNVRKIDMTFLENDGSIRVNDTKDFCRDEALKWRYNFCSSYEENEKNLLLLIYGKTDVSYTPSSKLANYLENRRAIHEKVSAYRSLIKSISGSDVPSHVKTALLNTVNAELHRLFPYK